jgi:hypothetical protein
MVSWAVVLNTFPNRELKYQSKLISVPAGRSGPAGSSGTSPVQKIAREFSGASGFAPAVTCCVMGGSRVGWASVHVAVGVPAILAAWSASVPVNHPSRLSGGGWKKSYPAP